MEKSEEERARILAEYAAMADDDEDDEADFDDDDDDSDDGSEEEDAEEDSNCAVLTGTVQLNDEMRLVYSGTWCMKEASSSDVKKNRKFKLKSKQVLCSSRDGSNSSNLFDFTNPTISKSKKKRPQAPTDSVEVVSKRLILMDGFFVTDDGQGSSKKIKERDVEVFFSNDAGTKKEDDKSCCTFVVTGKGTNEYGPFYFEGKYECTSNSSDDDKGPASASLICEKRYGVLAEKSASSPQRKRARSNDFSDEDNDDDDDAEAFGDDDADLNEVIALNEEANMSVEELRRRYYNNSDDDKGAGADKRESKKQKTKGGEESDDDDDECGF